MNRTRVIPVLLLKGQGLFKTERFKNPKYIGDPINAVRIFNEKEVDELIFLDISATPERRDPNYELLSDIASEAFMPMAYGGGIKTLAQIRKILALGFEKIIINTATYSNINLVVEAKSIYGAQSIVACVDVRRTLLGQYELYSNSAQSRERVALRDHLTTLVSAGVGEVMVNSVDRDGTMTGYDLKLLQEVGEAVNVPVIACGGAGSIDHFSQAIVQANVSAVAAGSLFVYVGRHRAVMINYPERRVLAGRLP
jgi:cyclase